MQGEDSINCFICFIHFIAIYCPCFVNSDFLINWNTFFWFIFNCWVVAVVQFNIIGF
ncbi:hypothetical protein SAL_1485 [Streptococcus agalactiae 515]|nr:hypothetical protein SAL_1485 [Streptococcus agalactiae 515]